MPCIWGQHNGSQLFIPVAILPASPALLGAAVHASAYAGPSSTVPALIDTGATVTGITSRLASQLNMQPVGKIAIHGVSGIQHHNSYLFHVGLKFSLPPGVLPPPGLPPPGPGQQTVQIHVLNKVIHGCEFHGGTAPFEVILGMDIISTGSLVVQGNSTFSFSF